MVKKLSFKGEKSAKKQARLKTRPVPNSVSNSTINNNQSTHFFVNGVQLMLDGINIERFTDGWTTMLLSDILNIQMEGIPVVVVCDRGEGPLALTVKKEVNQKTEDIETSVTTTHELNITSEENAVVYSRDVGAIHFIPNRVEPKSLSEIFYVLNVTSLTQSIHGKIISGDSSKRPDSRFYAFKTINGDYLSHDPVTHSLTTTMAITTNSMFQLKPLENKAMQFSLSCGGSEKAKVMVTPAGKVTVIEDDENLLPDLCPFTLRIKNSNSQTTNKICNSYKNSTVSQEFNDTESGKILREKLFDLKKLNIPITKNVVNELKKAISAGNVGEWMIEVKEKKYGDRRA